MEPYSYTCAWANESLPAWPVGWGPCGLRGVWCQRCALPWTPGYLQCRQCRAGHGGGHSRECCWPLEGREAWQGLGPARWVKGAVWRSEEWTCSGSGPGKHRRGRMRTTKLISHHSPQYKTEYRKTGRIKYGPLVINISQRTETNWRTKSSRQFLLNKNLNINIHCAIT